jgi:aerotaxis receptor
MTRPSAITLINEEVEFNFDQLFFSITDRKGRIELSNDVFSMVCGYSKEQLKGQPHNIIRHPDMPKYLFKMLWDSIQKGKPIGCYVKNLASNGKYYWVYALVLPVGERFLSIRLKATVTQVQLVENLYRQIVEAESISENIVNSILNQWLWRQQFPDYNSWMSHALNIEIKKRPPSMWKYHFFGREKPTWEISGAEINPAVSQIFDQVWSNVQILNKTFGEFFAKNELVKKHFKSFEKLLSDYYDLISKTFNDIASSNGNEVEKLNNLLVEGSFYTDLRNYITAINNIGHTYQFHIDSFNLHTKMLDLFIKNFFSSLGHQKIEYELFIETIDSILVLAKSVQNFVEHFKKEQLKLDQEVKKVVEFSTFLNKKMLSARDKYKPFHAHISVNSEMILRNMSTLTSEINDSVEDFIKSIEFADRVLLELKEQQKSA